MVNNLTCQVDIFCSKRFRRHRLYIIVSRNIEPIEKNIPEKAFVVPRHLIKLLFRQLTKILSVKGKLYIVNEVDATKSSS